MGSGRGTCGCCERPNIAFSNKFAGVYVCGFCIKHLKDADRHGVQFEQAKEEIKTAAMSMKPGQRQKAWSWSTWPVYGNKNPQDAPAEKPILGRDPCQVQSCKCFDRAFPGNCMSYGAKASAESCEIFSPIPWVDPVDSNLTDPPPQDKPANVGNERIFVLGSQISNVLIKNESQDAPLHDMGYPAPSILDKELICQRLKAEHEQQKSLALLISSESRSVPPNTDDTRYIIIDLHSETDIAEWLRRKAKVNRRSYLVDQVLAILDGHMAADREMDGRVA